MALVVEPFDIWVTSHAKDRAWERYGVCLDAMDVTEALPHSRLLRVWHDGREEREMHVSGKLMVLIWEPRRRMVVTVLPDR